MELKKCAMLIAAVVGVASIVVANSPSLFDDKMRGSTWSMAHSKGPPTVPTFK
jgi:hypothetical protein